MQNNNRNHSESPLKQSKSPLKTTESTIKSNTLPYLQTLESHNGISQNQRHSPRNADIRAQKHNEHTKIHTTSGFQRG